MRTFGNLLAFSPELWLLAGAVVVLLQARLMPRTSTTTVALVSLVLAFLALATQFKQTITILDGAFLLDGFAIFIQVVLLGAAALCLLASPSADLYACSASRSRDLAFSNSSRLIASSALFSTPAAFAHSEAARLEASTSSARRRAADSLLAALRARG